MNFYFSTEIVVFYRSQLFQYMADEGAETPTARQNFNFYFLLQTAASDISNQHKIYVSILPKTKAD